MDEEKMDETKEITDLKDLSLEALNHLEDTVESSMDENMETSDALFAREVVDIEHEPKRESFFKKLNYNWHKLDNKKKLLMILSIIFIFVLIGVLIYFLIPKKSTVEKTPDVILKEDNYRYENGTLIFLDDDGNEIGKYECENKDQERCGVAYLTNDDIFDTTIKQDENGNPLDLHSQIYFKRFVFVIDHASDTDKDIKLYDINAGITLKTVFSVKAYANNYVVLKDKSSKYGLEEITENKVSTVIPYQYDALGILPDQTDMKLVMVKKDNNSYLADLTNKILTKAFNTNIVGANDKYIKTKDSNGTYKVYDYNAHEVKESAQEFVMLLDNYMISIRSNKVYVTDYEGNKMSMLDISLSNNHYNPVEVYKNLKLDHTDKSFDTELNDQLLTIHVYNGEDKDNYSMNLNEGKLSSKLAFMDYFNGTLYFYKEDSKTNLIGSYNCTNRNTVESNTTSLDNCKLATESFYREITGNKKEVDESSKLGSIPLFGNQFVFIQDNSDTINLYDLVNKKSIALYSHVDTSSYTGINEITLSMADNVLFIAQSKSSSKFGVAMITSSGIKPVIKFEYNSIKRLGDYFVVATGQNDSYKYSLYTLEGGETLAKNFPKPIVDYNGDYLKTYSDNQYVLHNFNHSDNNTDSHDYVDLYKNHYLMIDNKKVTVYDYKNKVYVDGTGSKVVNLDSDDYTGKAYRVTDKEKEVIIEVLINGKYVAHTFQEVSDENESES